VLERLLPWRKRDPWWDDFINKEPNDPKNLVGLTVAAAPGGPVYGNKPEVHDTAAMTGQIKGFAEFLGSCLVAITNTDPAYLEDAPEDGSEGDTELYPYAIICAVKYEHDPNKARGIGGQLAQQKLAVINFQMRSYIRQLGYKASLRHPKSAEMAVAAGLGTIDKQGRFSAKRYGHRVWLGDVILTELPLVVDR
jgi:hypothetical protein